MPKSSLQAIRQFEDLASPVGAFVRDWCQVHPTNKVKVKRLYEAWKMWCEREGHPAGSSIMLGRNLRAVLPQLRVRGRGAGRHYVGLALNGSGREAVL